MTSRLDDERLSAMRDENARLRSELDEALSACAAANGVRDRMLTTNRELSAELAEARRAAGCRVPCDSGRLDVVCARLGGKNTGQEIGERLTSNG